MEAEGLTNFNFAVDLGYRSVVCAFVDTSLRQIRESSVCVCVCESQITNPSYSNTNNSVVLYNLVVKSSPTVLLKAEF